MCDQDHIYDIRFHNGLSFTFGMDTQIFMYDKDDNKIAQLDPTEIATVYSAYRMMIKEYLEEDQWAKEIR